jgi:D-aspartate ligase
VAIWYTNPEEYYKKIDFCKMNPAADLPGVVIIEGHVQGLANTRALGRAGIPVFVVSEYNCLAHYSRFSKKFFRCPDYLSAEFIDFLINLASIEGIRNWVLLPSNDHAVYNISLHSERLKDYFRIISPGPEILESIYNKELLIKLCLSIDVPVPLTWFPVNPEIIKHSEFRYPLLIKGKNGLSFYKSTGKKAFLINDKTNLIDVLDSITEYTPFSNIYLQNLLPFEKNKPVSLTAFSVNGEIRSYWMGIKIREHPLNFGTATYSRSIYKPELIPLAAKLLKKLAFTGVCEIEFLLDSRDLEYKLIEINARTWLWVDMAVKSGINYPLMVYNFLNNIDCDYSLSDRDDLEWMHYLTDIPYSLLGIMRRHYSIGEVIKSYRKLPIPAVLDFSDILPSFAEIALLPFLILKR